MEYSTILFLALLVGNKLKMVTATNCVLCFFCNHSYVKLLCEFVCAVSVQLFILPMYTSTVIVIINAMCEFMIKIFSWIF